MFLDYRDHPDYQEIPEHPDPSVLLENKDHKDLQVQMENPETKETKDDQDLTVDQDPQGDQVQMGQTD